jgi:hypothetical protein
MVAKDHRPSAEPRAGGADTRVAFIVGYSAEGGKIDAWGIHQKLSPMAPFRGDERAWEGLELFLVQNDARRDWKYNLGGYAVKDDVRTKFPPGLNPGALANTIFVIAAFFERRHDIGAILLRECTKLRRQSQSKDEPPMKTARGTSLGQRRSNGTVFASRYRTFLSHHAL